MRFWTTDILVICVCNVMGRKLGTYGWTLRDIRARKLVYENQGCIILSNCWLILNSAVRICLDFKCYSACAMGV